MAEHRRRRATPSGGGKPLAPFGLQAAHTRLLCGGSSMMLGHHPPRRASYPDPRRLQHGRSDFCHGLLVSCPINNMAFVAVARVVDLRRDDEAMRAIGEEEQQRSSGPPAATRRAEGTLADLFVAPRRRCHRIVSSSLRDLISKSPQQMPCYLWDRTLVGVVSKKEGRRLVEPHIESQTSEPSPSIRGRCPLILHARCQS